MQCDIAGGENKSKYLFGVLALFVKLGWYEEVQLHMLLKGHTHDIEDAAFGTFHDVIFNKGARECLCSLMPCCRFCVCIC